jgi:hypothetical protein
MMVVAGKNKSVERQCGRQRCYAVINFKRLLPCQPAQALPNLWKARLVLIRAQRGTHLDLYARK